MGIYNLRSKDTDLPRVLKIFAHLFPYFLNVVLNVFREKPKKEVKLRQNELP